MTELGDQLRKELSECTINIAKLIEQKNAEIARLRADYEAIWHQSQKLTVLNTRLRAALEPFAKAADELSSYPDETGLDLAPITLGDLRNAREALAGQKD